MTGAMRPTSYLLAGSAIGLGASLKGLCLPTRRRIGSFQGTEIVSLLVPSRAVSA